MYTLHKLSRRTQSSKYDDIEATWEEFSESVTFDAMYKFIVDYFPNITVVDDNDDVIMGGAISKVYAKALDDIERYCGGYEFSFLDQYGILYVVRKGFNLQKYYNNGYNDYNSGKNPYYNEVDYWEDNIEYHGKRVYNARRQEIERLERIFNDPGLIERYYFSVSRFIITASRTNDWYVGALE